MLRIFIPFFILSFYSLKSQENFLGHALHFTPKIKPILNFNESSYKKTLVEKYTSLFKNNKDLSSFVDYLLEGKKYYLFNNSEYEHWDSANVYLTKILNNLNYKSLAGNTTINIKIIRDAEINASAFEDGTIYFNAGFLAKVNSEAEIAAVLAHELGHIIKPHSYENYKARKKFKRNIYLGYQRSISGLIGAAINSSSNSKVLMSNEKESDEVAINLLQNSNYSNQALLSVFERFINLEKKYKAEKDYDGSFSVFYLQSHPSSVSRLNKVKKIKNNFGKSFLVDSVYFSQLKKQCTDETINLSFEDLDFSNCIEASFVQYLKYPKDPFYLFYLTESTRRLLELSPGLNDKYFITSRYKDFFNKPVNINSLKKCTAKTGGTIKPYDKQYLNSIFYKLSGPLLTVDSADYKKFTNNNIINPDTLPFLNYGDALIYFRDLNSINNYYLNNTFFNANFTAPISEREKQFCNLPNVTKKYLTKSTNDKILWVLYNVDHVVAEKKGVSSTEVDFIETTARNIINDVKLKGYDNYISTGNDLYFNEQNSLTQNLKWIYPQIKNQKLKKVKLPSNPLAILNGNFTLNPEDLITRDSANYNCNLINPELIAILNSYHYKGIVFSSIQIEDKTQKAILGSINSKTYILKHFYLDAKNQKVKFYMSSLGEGGFQSNLSVFSEFKKSAYYDVNKMIFETIKDVSK